MNYREHAEKIAQAIENGIAGRRDEQTLAIIRREVAFILADPDLPGRANQKLPEILMWADIYFSPRKHQRYRGGLDQIYTWMMEALNTARPMMPPAGLPYEKSKASN